MSLVLGDRLVKGTAGDFVNVPRGTVQETPERAKDPEQARPDDLDEVGARYAEAAPRYGMEFLVA
jgi:hypothetical protein